jgi:hypothetical protein
MRIKEWHRTVLLVVLLIMAVGYLMYLKTGYQAHLEDILR